MKQVAPTLVAETGKVRSQFYILGNLQYRGGNVWRIGHRAHRG